MSVRVRFAPSPTGYLHVGGARAALYNWLFARSHQGTLVLRSDDTDAERSTDEFHEDIVESLRWLGIDWDEGIDVGGPFEPYRQSQRLTRYGDVADLLLTAGAAYYGFETKEQLDGFRAEAQAQGRSPAYDGRFRVDADEAQLRRDAGEAAPVRFAVPRPGRTIVSDLIKGDVVFDHDQVDDFVILRSDGTPTYHLASTVDDIDFAITHVIRGEDILASAPKHILLASAVGAPVPHYAHLSLIFGPDGAKLSKRHGDTSIRAYRDAGFLPEAVRNYLAILGWSPGADREIVSVAEMVEKFDLADLSRNPAIFDAAKLEWMSGVYVRELSETEFAARSVPLVEADLGRILDPAERSVFGEMAHLVQERARLLTEVPAQVRFLFAPVVWDERSWQKVMTKPDARSAVEGGASLLAALDSWTADDIEGACRGLVRSLDLSVRKVFQPLRVAVTGSAVGPPLFESMAALGKEQTVQRLQAALDDM